jgi:proteic killer suppression protein
MKGLHFEKLQGARAHQRSVRLNKQWRLILELVDTKPEKTVRVIGIEDYH